MHHQTKQAQWQELVEDFEENGQPAEELTHLFCAQGLGQRLKRKQIKTQMGRVKKFV